MLTSASFFALIVQPSVRSQIARTISAIAHVGAARLALLDEVGVLGHARGVVDDADAVRVAERAHLAQVGQADRLAAGHVDRGGDADVRDLLGAELVDDPLQLLEVDVALEGVLARRVVRLVDDHVDERAARRAPGAAAWS